MSLRELILIDIAIGLIMLILLFFLIWLGKAILRAIKVLGRFLKALVDILSGTPKAISITQVGGFDMGTILGIAPGATGEFQLNLLPPGSALPAGSAAPTWQTSDPTNTALTPSADGMAVAVAAAPTIQNGATSFMLTATATFTAPGATTPTTLTKEVSVPFNFPTPPVPTSLDITQTS